MKHSHQKGALSGLVLIFLAIVVIAIIGIGWMWHKGGVVATDSSSATTTAAGVPNTGNDSYSYVISSSTPASGTVAQAPKTTTRTVTTYVRKTVASAGSSYTGVSGSVYHNATYGLTLRLPTAGYRTYITAGGPSGLPGTAQIHFIAPGEATDAFIINVWDKQGWNYVRTQENFVHLNTTNIGEGTYLGENFTWIYSYTIYSHAAEAQTALSGAVFY